MQQLSQVFAAPLARSHGAQFGNRCTRGMAKDLVCSCLYIHDARDALQRAKMLKKILGNLIK